MILLFFFLWELMLDERSRSDVYWIQLRFVGKRFHLIHGSVWRYLRIVSIFVWIKRASCRSTEVIPHRTYPFPDYYSVQKPKRPKCTIHAIMLRFSMGLPVSWNLAFSPSTNLLSAEPEIVFLCFYWRKNQCWENQN